MISERERWVRIKEFPIYEVSNLGRVANTINDFFVRPSLTLQGALKVGLVRNGKQYTRSLKVIVADSFVNGRTETFNTPVLMDGNQLNCVAHNLVWRPRWYAWSYSYQFHNIPPHFRKGPIVEISDDGIVLCAYLDIVEVGITNGLLFKDVWQGVISRQPVYPTSQLFLFADKV
jgi:hypothetical protein